MTTVAELIKQIADARKSFIDVASMFSGSSSKWKVTAETWCATEITEHLFWAEQGSVLGCGNRCTHTVNVNPTGRGTLLTKVCP